MGLADLARQPIDHYRHRVACVVDKEPVTTQMRLPHRNRQTSFPGAVKLAEPGVTIAAGLKLDIFVPQHLKRDVLALHLPIHGRPVRFGTIALTTSGCRNAVELRLECGVSQPRRQGPFQRRCPETLKHHADTGAAHAYLPRHLSRRQLCIVSQSQNLAHLAHLYSLRRHWLLLQKKLPATTG